MSRPRHRSAFEPRRRARRRVLQALYQWQINEQPAGEIIRQFTEEQDFAGVDHDYFDSLVRCITADPARYDAHVEPHLKRRAGDLDPMERAILRIAACEMVEHRETPYRVVIDEAVELAHRFGAEQGHTFINGVVDRLAAEHRPQERKE